MRLARRAPLGLVIALACGCGMSRAASVVAAPDPAPVPAASASGAADGPRLPAPLVPPLPVGTTPTPTTVVVISDASEALSLETTFGEVESVSVVALDAPLGLLTMDSEDGPRGGFPRACACPCGEACAECERPEDRAETLAPGGRVTLLWSGRLRRFGAGCFDAFAPAPGRYLVRVCTGEVVEGRLGPCGSATVTLPTTAPIEVHVGSRESLTCPLSPALLERAARAALSSMALRSIVPDRIARCEVQAECYAETDLPYGEDVVRGARYAVDPSSPPPRGCGVLVAPRGDRLLTRVLLPLPEGTNGGERFDHELDAEASRILSMRFEQ